MCAVVVVVLSFLERPLLFVDLLAPNKEKKMLFSFVTKQKPPTPETTFRKKQGSPNSPILELLLPSLGRWEILQMSAIQSITS
jgi:hypothetical protein